MTPNAELAYRVLDHIDAHPEQWDQDTYWHASGCGTVACFAGWAVALSGAAIDRNGDVLLSSLPLALAGQVNAALDAQPWTRDPAHPDLAEVPDVATALLGLSSEQRRDLYYAGNSREELGELVAGYFGPRPLTDDGALEMSAAEIRAELAIDRLALPQPSMAELNVAGDITNTNRGMTL